MSDLRLMSEIDRLRRAVERLDAEWGACAHRNRELRAVVAAQREAIQDALIVLEAALRLTDAEEVSEPSPERETAHRVTDRGGSLTSPNTEEVSEPEVRGGHASAVTTVVGASAHGDPPAAGSTRRGPTSPKQDPGTSGSLTSPVDGGKP